MKRKKSQICSRVCGSQYAKKGALISSEYICNLQYDFNLIKFNLLGCYRLASISIVLCTIWSYLLIQVAFARNIWVFHCVTLLWASYQIRKIAGCACAGNAGNVFPRRRFQRKPLVSDPGMHHGTCVTHVPWCMSGSLTCGDGENVPSIPGACALAILRIWQEAHGCNSLWTW